VKLTLIIAGRYSSCKLSQQIWFDECSKHNIELDVLNLEHENGQSLATQLNLKSFPALILNNKIIAVGHPDIKTAEKIISDLIPSS